MRRQFRVIVAGSRGATSYKTFRLLERKLNSILEKKSITHDIIIISGTASGADKLGERYAEDKNYTVKQFPADWNKYGKRAGYMRNVEMANNADALVALWDGQSRGTNHMINIARMQGLPTRVIRYDWQQ
tara:strand:- start:142 stop:531 length:390 start_codon:yes stop_codon:yes gene_type:complete